MVRANPNIIGYSMTAVHDHGFAGEGFLSLVGEFKPGHMITMQEGWAPLRWCMLTYPTHLYNTEPIRLRAVLADEDVLKEGTYPVSLKIFNKDEIIWKKETSVTVKEGYRPYTHNVFDQVIVIPNLKDGEYTFCAELEEGALAQGGRVNFTVANRKKLPKLNKNVRLVGNIPESAKTLLENAGAKIVPLDKEDGIILVGVCNNKEIWNKVYSYIEKGQKAVFMDRWSLTEEGKYYGFLDEEKEAVNIRRTDGSKAFLVSNWEWLYHRMPIAKPHKLLGSLQARGILDQNYYNAVLSQQYLRCEKKADLSAVTAFAMNVVSSGGVGPILGSIVGKNSYGLGEYVFLTLEVLENIGHPAADLVFLTLLNA